MYVHLDSCKFILAISRMFVFLKIFRAKISIHVLRYIQFVSKSSFRKPKILRMPVMTVGILNERKIIVRFGNKSYHI